MVVMFQPQVHLRLPCYDFTSVVYLDLTTTEVVASIDINSHGVTGGVYKIRERIHRGMLIHDY